MDYLCRISIDNCFGLGLINGDDELQWQTRLKRHSYGEYSMAVVQANSTLEDQGQVFASPSATFIGVYDGHGGPYASRFINDRLFYLLDKFASEQGGLSADVIRKAFDQTEQEFLQVVRKTWTTDPHIALSGSCCLVGALSNEILYIANLGDSRAVLGRRVSNGGLFSMPTVAAERLTSDHNVGVEEVRKEVRALHPDDSHIVVYSSGFWRIKGIIQVSRAIGDIYLKCPEFNRLYEQLGSSVPLKRAVITAEPSILVRKLDRDDMFLIFASDGLWEHLSDEAAVDIVFRSPRSGIAKRLIRTAIEEAARKVGIKYEDMKSIEKGVRRHFHDDMIVMVVYLDHLLPHSKDTSFFDFTLSPLDIASYTPDEAGSVV